VLLWGGDLSKFEDEVIQKVFNSKDGHWEKGWRKAQGAHRNTLTRSFLTKDVKCTLHAKPLGVSKT
jgi:hypothetical protein